MTKTNYHHGDLRNALLIAAEQELDERGTEKFSLRGVAKRAGVSHAAPAHHFGDVAGVMTALATVGFQRFCKILEDRRQVFGDSNQHPVVYVGLGYIEFALAYPRLFVLMFTSDYPDFDNEVLDEVSMESFEYLLEAVDQVEANQQADSISINTAAMAAWSTIHGISELLLHGRMRSVLSLPAEQQQMAIQQILERAIVATEYRN